MALSICLHVLGVPVKTEDLLKENPPNRYGANFQELENLVKSYGCFSYSSWFNTSCLLRSVSQDCPAIFSASDENHFYVTTGYLSDGSIAVYDPTYLVLIRMSLGEFQQKCSNRAMLIARRPIKRSSRSRKSIVVGGVLVALGFFVQRKMR